MQRRDALVRHAIVRPEHLGWQASGALVHLIHVEHVIGGRKQHALALREDHSLQHVHRLSDVGHAYAIAVGMENVQVGRCGERIS